MTKNTKLIRVKHDDLTKIRANYPNTTDSNRINRLLKEKNSQTERFNKFIKRIEEKYL